MALALPKAIHGSLSCRSLVRRLQSPFFQPSRIQSYSTGHLSRNGRSFRMAVIGSGPAGFYTAYRVMSRIEEAKVDMYEALPVPFGLVRFGVAPDHPEVKNCQDKFEEVASSPNFTFIGNVSVGQPSDRSDGSSVPLASLLPHYDAVVFAYGAAKDRTLNIPGESTLQGIYSAREFVAWYNGLPEAAGLTPDLTQGDEAVVIGQGNVALDVTRMLLEDVDVLRKTDIAAHALETLSQSKIKRVHVVGRRGPMQAAFTIKEVRELMKLSDVAFHPTDKNLIPEDLKALPRGPKRLMEVIVKGSASSPNTASKSWSLDFCLSPKSFGARSDAPERVGFTEFEKTSLSSPFDRDAYVTSTGEMTKLPSSAVFRSIGYKSVPLREFSDLRIPFDERRGIVQNDGHGRVAQEVRRQDATLEYAPFPGLYCAGWVKRGPTGVIASTMEDAFSTADAIAQDWTSGANLKGTGKDAEAPGWEGVKTETQLERARVVQWDDWHKIDKAEKEKGRDKGKGREKFTSTADMLAVLG